MNINISGEVVRTSQLPKRIIGLGDYLIALNSSPLETSTVLVSDFVSFLNTQFATSLASLTDVSINGPLVGQALVYDGSRWVNQGIGELDTLNSVTTRGNSTTNSITVGGVYSPYLRLDTVATPTLVPGMFAWNDADGTANLRLKGNNVTLQLGQETVAHVVNKTGADLLESQYKVVRVRVASEGGSQGQRLAVVLAQGDNDPDSATTLGVVTENIGNNQEGFITILGNVNNINTTGSLQGETWVDGDVLYLSPITPGSLTKVKPVAPQHTLIVGYVVYAHQNNGKIFVKVDNGYELDELHNVLISSPANNDLLQYNSTQQVWKNIAASVAVPTPTLAQVTTAGNTTTNAITVGGLTANNKVYLGSNTPHSNDATNIVTVNGIMSLSNGYIRIDGQNKIQMSTSSWTWDTAILPTAKGFQGYSILDFTLRTGSTSYNLDLGLAGQTNLRVANTTGNILINTTTDAGYKLDVNGTARIQGDFIAGLQGASTTVFRFHAGTSYGGQANITFAGQGYNGVSIGIGSGANPFLGNNLLITRSYLNEYGNHAYGFVGFDNTLPMSFRFGAAGSSIEALRLTNTQVTAYQKFVTTGSITAASALAQGVLFNNTLVAAANNDVLVGLDINPTFTNGAFTGVKNIGLRVPSNVLIGGSTYYTQSSSGQTFTSALQINGNISLINSSTTDRFNLITTDPSAFWQARLDGRYGLSTIIGITNTPGAYNGVLGNDAILTGMSMEIAGTLGAQTRIATRGPVTLDGSANRYIRFWEPGVAKRAVIGHTDNADGGHIVIRTGDATTLADGTQAVRIFQTTQNVLIGSSTTDAGYKLDVNGTGRFSSTLTVATTASGGSPSNSILISTSESGNGGRISWGDSNTSILRYSNSLYFREYTGNFRFESTGSGAALFNISGAATTVTSGSFVTNGSITAASSLARGVYMNNTLVASANNDVLVGLDIQPTFTNGAFTTPRNIGLRVQSGRVVIGTDTASAYPPTLLVASNQTLFATTPAHSGLWVTEANSGNYAKIAFFSNSYPTNFAVGQTGTTYTTGMQNKSFLHSNTDIWFTLSGSGSPDAANPAMILFNATKNISINSTTDAGYKLDVNGTVRIQNKLTCFNPVSMNLTSNYAAEIGFNANGRLAIGYNVTSGSILQAVFMTSAADLFLQPFGGSLMIGANIAPNASAIVQIDSTTKGFLLPRLTTAQILAIASPAEGLQVYNTDLKTICFYNGTAWQRVTATAM